MGGTSVEYLTDRLRRAGRFDLLDAIARRELSTFAAAEAAGIVRRRAVLGTGSPNASNRRNWAVLRATGKVPALEPREPEPPAQAKFSPATRAIVARPVEDGRVDLVIAVAERRISPQAAARLAAGHGRHRLTREDVEEAPKPEAPKPKKPAEVPFDPAALIA